MIQLVLLIIGVICIILGWDFERAVDIILFLIGIACVIFAGAGALVDAFE